MTMRELFELARAKWPGATVFVECTAKHFSHCPNDPPEVEWRVHALGEHASIFGGSPEEVAAQIRDGQTIALASAACEELPS